MPKPTNTPCVLIIRDGWGHNPNFNHRPFNAIELARTPVSDRLMGEYPTVLIKTSGLDVGLPDNTMGNSEVGHQNIGAGRIVNQEPVRITKAMEADGFEGNDVLVDGIKRAKRKGTAIHLMGLASDAGVHGMISHLFGLLELCKTLEQSEVYIHCFMDGRDTGPYTGKAFIQQIEAKIQEIGVGRIVSVIGRYWVMDRDNRWDRVAKAYACMTGRGREEVIDEIRFMHSAATAVQFYYDNPINRSMQGDEFVLPMIITDEQSDAIHTRVREDDTVIFWNYRGDRPREICRAFVYPGFHGDAQIEPSPETGERGFDRGDRLHVHFVAMTGYSKDLDPYLNVAFPKQAPMEQIGGEYLAQLGLTQFRCAETEKFPHVTFFFNDYRAEPFEGEHHAIIQSPMVATYDLKPDMSAPIVMEAVIGRLVADDCEDVLIVNFANGDMVGHTGKLDAAIWACETVDDCVGRIIEQVLRRGGSAIVTADHGNAEQIYNPVTLSAHTAHTTYAVPLILIGERFKGRLLREGGRLADIFPTMLEMMGLPKPEAMTGESLLIPAGAGDQAGATEASASSASTLLV
ncbi:MAG: 2,3-bisphosphoglycerate-independent phosphoglycerate mutase [Phycisphaerales bacterium]|nr:2,3-bisphosphoglycerate-independent phosphoglycerate mutase [Phycisphaerales bacterium]